MGHLQLIQAEKERQVEQQQQQLKSLEEKLIEEASKRFEVTNKLEVEQGKVMGYQVQLLELTQRIERMQKDHINETDKIKWEIAANLKTKDLQLEAITKAQALTQH